MNSKPLSTWKTIMLATVATLSTLGLVVSSFFAVNNTINQKVDYVFKPTLVHAGEYTTQATAGSERYVKGLNIDGRLGAHTESTEIREWMTLPDNETFVKMSGAWQHTVGLTTNREVFVWGKNTSGELATSNYNPAFPKQLNVSVIYKTVVSDNEKVYAIDSANNLFVWGKGEYLGIPELPGTPTPTQILPGVQFQKVAIGKNFVLALASNGDLYTWGDNSKGQLGLGDTRPRTEPTLVPDLKFKNIDANLEAEISAGITENNELYMWGDNSKGQLGVGEDWRQQQEDENQRVKDLIEQIKEDDENRKESLIEACQVTRDEEIEEWDEQEKERRERWEEEQRNNNTPPVTDPDDETPPEEPGEENIVEEYPEPPTERPTWDETCTEQVEETFEETDTSDITPRTIKEPELKGNSNIPVKVNSDELFSVVAVGTENVYAININNKLYGWGIDTKGQSGIEIDDDTHTQVPVAIQTNYQFKQIDAGNKIGAAVTTQNDLFMWGVDTNTKTMLTHEENIKPRLVTTSVNNIFINKTEIYAIKQDNTFAYWGTFTVTPDGKQTETEYDTIQTNDFKVKTITSTAFTGLALTPSNELVVWGSNQDGHYGTGEVENESKEIHKIIVNEFIDVAAGQKYTLIVDYQGKIWGFGKNNYNQIGNYAPKEKTATPTIVPLPVKAKLVTAGMNYSYAVGQNNTLWMWGENYSNPQQLEGIEDNIKQIVTSNHTLYVLTETGKIYEYSPYNIGVTYDENSQTTTNVNLIESSEQFVSIETSPGGGGYAINNKGHLYAWAYPTNIKTYTTDRPEETYSPTPILIDDSKQYTQISSSSTHTLFLTDDNAIQITGEEPYGTYGTENPQDNLIRPLHTNITAVTEENTNE